jgi:hypothetical protein
MQKGRKVTEKQRNKRKNDRKTKEPDKAYWSKGKKLKRFRDVLQKPHAQHKSSFQKNAAQVYCNKLVLHSVLEAHKNKLHLCGPGNNITSKNSTCPLLHWHFRHVARVSLWTDHTSATGHFTLLISNCLCTALTNCQNITGVVRDILLE